MRRRPIFSSEPFFEMDSSCDGRPETSSWTRGVGASSPPLRTGHRATGNSISRSGTAMASDPARVANVPGSPRSLLPVTRLGSRALAKTGIAAALHWSGAAHPLSAVAGWQRTPPVITYHRVVADFAAHAQHTVPSMLISSKMLEQHLEWMGRRFRFVSLDELGSHLESGAAFDKPVVAITFDDGYRDVYEHAFPLLKRKGIPAAIFVVSDLVATTILQLHDTLSLGVARALSAGASARRGVGRLFGDLAVPRRRAPPPTAGSAPPPPAGAPAGRGSGRLCAPLVAPWPAPAEETPHPAPC